MKGLIPLHVADIGRGTVRFFRSPLEDGPDLPWVAIDDVHAVASWPRAVRRQFAACILDEYVAVSRMVDTPTGGTLIGPHWMAQGAIDAAIEVGVCAPTVRRDYDLAASEAGRLLVAAMPQLDGVRYLIEGARRWLAPEG